MTSEWSPPQRPEARLWLEQFNEQLGEWLASGVTDRAAFDGIVRALRSLAEREPESGTMVAALAATLLHQHAEVLAPGEAADVANAGLVAERLPAEGSAHLRAWLEVEASQAELAASHLTDAARAAGRALSTLDDANSDSSVSALLRARALTLQGVALDALLDAGGALGAYRALTLQRVERDAGGALGAYRAAEEIAGALVADEQRLRQLPIETLALLYGGADAPVEAMQSEMQLLWQELSLVRIAIATGAARTCALAAPDELDRQLEATSTVFRQHGIGDTSPLLLVPAARHAGQKARDRLREVVLAACEQTDVPRDGFAAMFEAAACCAAETPEDARAHLDAAGQEWLGVADELVAAAGVGLAFTGATIHDIELEAMQHEFMRRLDRLDDLHDPRLDDSRLRAAFDEPVALAVLALAPQVEGAPGSPDRVRLARILDFELGLRSPLDRWLPAGDGEADIPELKAAASLAADRIGRLGRALSGWPGAAAILLRRAGPRTIALCASADGTFVVHLGAAHRDAADNLVDALDNEVEALELTGSAGSEDTLRALGCRAFDALPVEVRALIAASHTVLVCPDHRTGGDAVPYELYHDGTDWLGTRKVMARLPSLRALVRAVEGSARRATHRRALALAVPDAPGNPVLQHATGEAEDARERLRSNGWDVPDIEEQRITPDFLLDRLPWIRHLHIAAHGEAEGVSEALLLADGGRLTSVDLAAHPLPRAATAYINACSLGTTRWVGGGRSKGIAYALFEAGSPAVIANLLPVEDELASELAKAFYGRATDTPVGDALRAARRDIRSTGSPVLWGSTILIGDPRATLEEPWGGPPLVDRLLDALMLQAGDQDAVRMEAARSLGTESSNPRLDAAVHLVRGIAALGAEPDASSRAPVAAACRVALDLDYLPGAALLAAILASTYGEDDERDETLRVLEGVLQVLEPLEHDDGPWKQLLDRTLVQWMLARQGERVPGLQVQGATSDNERDEMFLFGEVRRDAHLASEARRIRAGETATSTEVASTERDLLHEAVTASRSVHLEDPPEVAAYCGQFTEKLIAAGAVSHEAQPHAATGIAGLLYWLWGSQNAFALPPEMAEGQAGTLGELVVAIRDHWPPVASEWFTELAPLPETVKAELDGLEGLPYDERLYPAIDAAIGRIEEDVSAALSRVRDKEPDRSPDAMAFALGVLIQRNTYSFLDGSVPEDIGERLTRVHTRISADAHAAFFPWLATGFRGAREHEPDELERWRMGLTTSRADVGEAGTEEYDRPVPDTRRLLISYSQQDEPWHDRLAAHLNVLDVNLNSWPDDLVAAGSDSREDFETALDEADAAILIVTPRFLGSPFIKDAQLRDLFEQRTNVGMPVFSLVAEPSLWRRVPWLELMHVVAIVDRDLPEPSSHEIDQKLAAFAEEIDGALSASGTTDETASDYAAAPSERDAAPLLSPEERRARIRYLLQQPPGDSFDGLPEGLLETITDQGQLPLLEEKLKPEAPYLEAANAIKAIGQLADWEWDHRSVKSEGSIPKLTEFYERTDDRSLRGLILDAMFKFEAPEIPFEFILDRLAEDHVQLKAAILAPLQFYVNKPYIADLVNERLLPLLHEFCTYPLRQSIYSDEWHSEEDFRFWVFRCLGGIGSADSAPIIEEYLETHDWPLGTLAEAANAYWDITGSPRFVGILRRAETEGQLGNTEHALREMEKHLQEHGVEAEGE